MTTKIKLAGIAAGLFILLNPGISFSQTTLKTAKESGSTTTGRGLMVGGAGAAYKTGNKPVEIFYQSTGLQSDFIQAKKGDRTLTVNGTTEMNGMVGVASSDPMKKAGTVLPVAQITGKESVVFLPGEPVPGAEIYIELEPDNANSRKIPVNSANPLTKKIAKESGITSGKANISFTLNEKAFTYYLVNGERWVSSGVYVFGMETNINRVKSYSEFVVLIREPQKSFTLSNGGPYSQSISNIEDNAKSATPVTTGDIEINVKLYLVNSFTDIKQ